METHQDPISPPAPPAFEVEIEDAYTPNFQRGSPIMVSQDNNYSLPSANTRIRHKGLTQDYMLIMMERSTYKAPVTTRQAASRTFPMQFLFDLAYAVLNNKTGDLLEYCHLMKHPKYKDTWMKSCGTTEIRRLVTTTETNFFKSKEEVPTDLRKDVTYRCVLCTYRSKKTDPYCTRITTGGNLINCPNNCGTPTADLLTVKLLLNSVISMDNARLMTIDIKDFYLMTPMKCYKYFCMKINLFPQDIIDEYNLHEKVDADGKVYCKVRSGMYGLPQAEILAQQLLEERLIVAGYRQSKSTPGYWAPGYWAHDWQPFSFTLVSTILASSTSTEMMSCTYWTPSRRTTKSTQAGRAQDI